MISNVVSLYKSECVHLVYVCVCALVFEHDCFVCVCQRGNSNQGDIRCGWGSSLTTLKRGHHQRSCMTLGPSCISLWGLIILAGALLSRLCGPFHEHTKNTTPKYAGRRRWGRRVVVVVAWVKVKKTQKKRGIKRREEALFRETAYLKKNRSLLDVWWLKRWDVVIVATIKEKNSETLMWGWLFFCEWKHDETNFSSSCSRSVPQLALTWLFCSLSGSFLMNFTLYCQRVVVAEMTLLSGLQHPLLCERLCVSLYDLMGKSFWSGINTTKDLLTDVSIIEKQLMLLCFNLAIHELFVSLTYV